ncbi:TlpA family protein disulfide reductase [Candidatus Aerophobetes bacterium]|uniref:TlpA family protein disulfide reductase n=1 Tax=Aerophobetes bacterium TaxID=2030807 RepID=A0A523QK33_UNCAE|nr:MAG: TlpA family protein disulfide reductase [Candidatus Aerophobetes bacterium]
MELRKRSTIIIILLIVICIVFAYFYLSYREEKIQREREVEYERLYPSLGIQRVDPPEEAEDFTLKTLKGGTVSLKDYRGRLIFLNFWATWCGPCRAEMPSMQRLWEEFKEEDFVILAINIQEESKLVSSFMNERGLSFPVLLDEKGKVARSYGIRGIPTTFFLNPEGEIIGKAVGARDWDSEESFQLIEELLLEALLGG